MKIQEKGKQEKNNTNPPTQSIHNEITKLKYKWQYNDVTNTNTNINKRPRTTRDTQLLHNNKNSK